MNNDSEYKETNQKLDQALLLLSPHFLNEHCLKVLEYLIRVYEVHICLPEQILLYFFPYFQSQLFTRLLQLIDFKAVGNECFFMGQYISKGYCISEEELVNSIGRDPTFLRKLLDTLRKMIAASSSKLTHHYAYMNLIAAILVGLIGRKASEDILRIVTQYVIEGISSDNDELMNSALLVLNSLSGDLRLAKDYLNHIISMLMNNIQIRSDPTAICKSILVAARSRWLEIELEEDHFQVILDDKNKRIYSLIRKVK